jgi:hypothetical protein
MVIYFSRKSYCTSEKHMVFIGDAKEIQYSMRQVRRKTLLLSSQIDYTTGRDSLFDKPTYSAKWRHLQIIS